MRTTEKQLRTALNRYCNAFGFRVATSATDVGGLLLDHNGAYGGWQVMQISSDTGAERHFPTGGFRARVPASVLFERLLFAADSMLEHTEAQFRG